MIFVALYFITSKLYAISFLATLNTRRTVGGRGTEQEDETETNHTNIFHLGTRMPTVGGVENQQYWDTRKATPEMPIIPSVPSLPFVSEVRP